MADGSLPADPIPLCVDLDGTLIRTDMLHETALLLAGTAPLSLAAMPRWLAGGKANLKTLLAERVEIDPASLPYRADVLALIDEARAMGRLVVLATAAPERIAIAIAAHLGLFDEVFSSSHDTNLASKNKAAALVARFGERGFDYIGNDYADLAVIAHARRGYLVSSPGRLRRKAMRVHRDVVFLDKAGGGLKSWGKALRVHQWLKNLLVLVPLAAGHRLGDPALIVATLIAFLSFSLCASSVYIVNDLLDLRSDRLHHRKHNRPFASGALPVASGVIAAPVLLATALGLALMLPRAFPLVLLIYCITTTAYSAFLKKQVVVDVMLLAGLYTLRLLAGSAATMIRPSFWLLAFSMFIFLCLAIVKRYSELRRIAPGLQLVAGRGYMPDDLPVLLSLGSASGMVSVLILAMYMEFAIVPKLYPTHEWLWAAPPLMLYWTTRLWMKAQRGEVDEDPVVFAATDWQSLIVVALMGTAFALASSQWRFW